MADMKYQREERHRDGNKSIKTEQESLKIRLATAEGLYWGGGTGGRLILEFRGRESIVQRL